jgi:arylsulfatase A-like enzyme
MLTGRLPEELGLQANVSQLPPSAVTVAEVLRLQGWHTGAVVSNWVLREGTGIERGFERFDARFPQREENREMPERVGADTTAAALAVLDDLRARGGATFLWVHYQDPHGPYTPPEGYRQRFLEAERAAPDGTRMLGAAQQGYGGIPRYQLVEGPPEAGFYRAGYDGEVAYLDDQIGLLLAGLAERGLDANARIVFTADHGEGLGEQDYWFAHGRLLSESLVRVPLAIRAPGVPAARIEEPVSTLDVFTTLLALAGVALPPGVEGRDLDSSRPGRDEIYLAALRGSPVPRFGLIAEGYKYLVTEYPAGLEEQLLRLGEDETDLAAADPERVRAMRERLRAIRAALPRRAERRQIIGAEEREKLRRLGYVEEDAP